MTLAAIAEDSGPRTITQAELLSNAGDVEGDSLTATGLSISAGAGTLVDNGDGTWNYNPAPNDVSSVSFSYTISDGTAAPIVASASMDITPVNDAPTIAIPIPDQLATEDIVFSFQFDSATFNDIEGDALTYSSDASGWLSFDAPTRTFSGTPLNADVGTTSVTVTASDGNGGSDTATVTITITGVNDGPTANADGFGTDEDTSFTTGNALANDTDPDASDTLSVTGINTAGTVGLVTDNGDGTFTYDPNGQFESLAVGETATDSFTYTISDGNGGTDAATDRKSVV